MRLEILVEEPSMEEALRHILPKVIHGRAKYKVINFGSKWSLLKRLPQRLAAYQQQMQTGDELRLVILLDRDADDCQVLKVKLEQMARNAGLFTKTRPDPDGRFQVLIRLAIEELEAWYIGDPIAIRKAFRGLPDISSNGIFRNPDNIAGGTWEALHRFLKKHGIFRNSFPKIEAARRIAPHLDCNRNRSRSFVSFCSGVDALLS